MFSIQFGWRPIDTAPIDTDVMLIVTDGGEPYAVLKPFKLTAAGWVSSGKGTPLAAHAAAVEAIRCPPNETMNAGHAMSAFVSCRHTAVHALVGSGPRLCENEI